MNKTQPITSKQMIKRKPTASTPVRYKIEHKVKQFVSHLKELEGDPHHIAMGMAIGVFVAMTPTMPFHIIIAIILAFLFRGSKAAAFIGVWVSNPATIPFVYLASYKVGMFFMGNLTPCDDKYESIFKLCKLDLDVTVAMIAGGAILGIPAGLAAYFITRKFVSTLRAHKKSDL